MLEAKLCRHRPSSLSLNEGGHAKTAATSREKMYTNSHTPTILLHRELHVDRRLGEERRAPFSSSPTLASASVANKGHYVQHTIQSSFLFISEHFWCKGIDSLTCLRSVLSKKKLLAKWSFLSQSAANLFPLCLVSIRFLVPPALPPFYVKTCRLPPSQASSSCRYHQKITES